MKDRMMEFRIADTFTDSLVRLTGDEQKAAKTTAFDLQLDPANPGVKFRSPDIPPMKPVRFLRHSRVFRQKTAS